MKMKLSIGGIAANVRQLAAIAGVVVSVGNIDHLPANVRGILLAGSSILLTVEHVLDGLQSGNVPNSSSQPAGQA